MVQETLDIAGHTLKATVLPVDRELQQAIFPGVVAQVQALALVQIHVTTRPGWQKGTSISTTDPGDSLLLTRMAHEMRERDFVSCKIPANGQLTIGMQDGAVETITAHDTSTVLMALPGTDMTTTMDILRDIAGEMDARGPNIKDIVYPGRTEAVLANQPNAILDDLYDRVQAIAPDLPVEQRTTLVGALTTLIVKNDGSTFDWGLNNAFGKAPELTDTQKDQLTALAREKITDYILNQPTVQKG